MVRKEGFPKENELLICIPREISQFAAWCELMEYPHLKGIINISEAIGKWIFDIREVVKKGKMYVAKVVRVEEKNNLVHLSLKRVSKFEERDKLNEFRRERGAEKILEMAGKFLRKRLDSAYREVGFKLQKKFGFLSTAFYQIKENPKVLEELGIDKKWKNAILKAVEMAIKEKEVILKANFSLKFKEWDGIERVKKILLEIEKAGYEVKYISTPLYRIEKKTTEPKTEEKKFKGFLERMKEKAKKLGGEASFEFLE